jgi:hypothetical protein
LKFEWTSECKEIFQYLKNLLTSEPILNIIDQNKDFIMFTDACKEWIGGVLSQNGNVICCKSRKLKEYERNYSTHDLELVTIVHSLNMWTHYHTKKIFELKTDHSGLKYLIEQPTLNVRQIIWLKFLNDYELGIKHIKTKEYKVTIAFSRSVHEMHATMIIMYKYDLKDRIFAATKSDQHYLETKEIM